MSDEEKSEGKAPKFFLYLMSYFRMAQAAPLELCVSTCEGCLGNFV